MSVVKHNIFLWAFDDLVYVFRGPFRFGAFCCDIWQDSHRWTWATDNGRILNLRFLLLLFLFFSSLFLTQMDWAIGNDYWKCVTFVAEGLGVTGPSGNEWMSTQWKSHRAHSLAIDGSWKRGFVCVCICLCGCVWMCVCVSRITHMPIGDLTKKMCGRQGRGYYPCNSIVTYGWGICVRIVC